ncbi:GNAT family N-acetyltransferase [Rubritalea tangerina]|uniref:GNAT family N-acetyltransferase n=2 Tax=Rubritalea tangerina TaxID=430798 RepID=A0ABW4Z6G7_9BACT
MHFVPESIQIRLEDGTDVLLREAGEKDRERALDAFDRMGPEDVRMRFWRDLIELDEDMLDRLVRADQINHLAWCALNPDRLDDDPGYAAASVWRMEDGSGEISITVLPDYQGRGIGLVLFALMWVLAEVLGMSGLKANVLRTNVRAVSWFSGLGGEMVGHSQYLEFQFNLSTKVRNDKLAYWLAVFREEFVGCS